jgi:hypothetical protein
VCASLILWHAQSTCRQLPVYVLRSTRERALQRANADRNLNAATPHGEESSQQSFWRVVGADVRVQVSSMSEGDSLFLPIRPRLVVCVLPVFTGRSMQRGIEAITDTTHSHAHEEMEC